MVLAVLSAAGCGADGRGDRDRASPEALASFERLRPLPRLDVAHYRVPPLLDRRDVYGADRAGPLPPRVPPSPPPVCGPHTTADAADLTPPRPSRVVRGLSVAREPQHVVPS